MSFADLVAKVDQVARVRLGAKVTYTSGVGEAVEVDGIFDDAYDRLTMGEIGVSSRGPGVFLRSSELTSDPETDRGARVLANGVEYRIHEVQPDALGGVVLLLHRM